MARTKQLNLVVQFGGTPYSVNDLGFGKSPRFELYNQTTKQIEAKSDNPRDFDKLVWKEKENVYFSETKPNCKRKRRNRTT